MTPQERYDRYWGRKAAARASKPSDVWISWGLPTAGLVITCELLYLFLVAERTGGTSVLGVLATGACAAVAACFQVLHEAVRGVDHVGGNRFVVISVVSAGVTALAVLAQLVFVH
ncbi:hypothetical protein OIE67_44715 [Nonomuraea fuscirosea]|uniref:hypothetical protein n=1 Tax=Nonomuraea fuscirosea TaxID=1291556 RepID=UPI002DDBBC3F|nr:hypothetical protein [Nonomuraea fuscirosea]WSA51082.1 hypothetical protein OIE67_44715 [Nonomuraea fuscirosea]